MRDSAGITLVENAAPAQPAAALATDPVLSIGVVDGPLEYQFYNVAGAARLGDGRIVVAEGPSGRLRWFDSDGTLVHAAGGQGRGPGEFRYIAALVAMPGDSIAVWDAPLGPVSVFGPAGDFVRTDPIDRARITALLGPDHFTEGVQPLPDGSLVLSVYESERGTTRPAGEVFRPYLAFHRVHRGLARVDTLGEFGGLPQMLVDVGSDRPAPAVLPFPTHARLAAGGSPLRIYAGNGETFQVHAFDADGRLERIVRANVPAHIVSDDDLAAAQADLRAFGERTGRMPEVERILAALPPQPQLPAYDALAASDVGDLWVRAWPAPTADSATWLVFSPDGTWRMSVTLPRRFTVHHIRGDRILGVDKDALDVERIVLHTLRR